MRPPVLETDGEIVGEPHDDDISVREPPPPPIGPLVEYIVQVHVRQQRRRRSALGCTFHALRPFPVLDDSRVQPLSDETQDPLIRDPVLEKPLQPTVIKPIEKSRTSASSTQFTLLRSIPTASASSA